MTDSNGQPRSQLDREFATTHWSVVLLAGAAGSVDADQALEHLCRAYWYPLYVYVRRQGHSAADAEDLTQGFFARLLERKYLRLADPQRGRFRTFLLSSLKNFMVTEWEKSRAQKRGGEHLFFSWDEQNAEVRYTAEPVDGLTPDLIYDKRWAVTLLEKVMSQLRENYAADGKEALFDRLRPLVYGDAVADGYDSISADFGLSEGSVRVTMHRLRESFRKMLRNEIARTVDSPADIDEELRHLVGALRN